MSDDDDDDGFMSHAADEPTAMWGGDMLDQLGIDRPPSEPPPKGLAPPSKGSSVQVSLEPESTSAPKAAPKSQAVQWAVLIVGALALAAVAFFLVRALR
ncbi:MAG: hypothetical protein JJ863_01195 [Deltaproteobacteria bacterium]|nr:hypothetical protein [Deltaproteobacteria bacterium]